MSEIIATEEQKVEAPNFFNMDNWKNEPSQAVIPAVQEQKIEEIVEQKVEQVIEKIADTPATSPVETKREFANEISEKIHNLLVEGKESDVMAYLSEQKRFSEVEKLSTSDAIKMQLEYANKDYSKSEIDDLFNEKYQMPEPIVQEFDEVDEDFSKREEKYNKEVAKIESRISRDSKPAIAELQKLKQEIILPYTPRETEQSVKELTQEELDTQKAQYESFLKSASEEVSKFDGYNTTYKDGEVDVNVGYKLTADQKNEILPLVALSETNAPQFLKEIGWLNEQGKLNTAKLIKDLPFILRGEQILQDITENAGGKIIAESKKSIKNIDYSGRSNGGGDMGRTAEQVTGDFVSHFFKQ